MYILILVATACLSLLAGYLICKFMLNKRSYSGTIIVIPSEDKLVYSLELDENPEKLQHMSEVTFKVEFSDESS